MSLTRVGRAYADQVLPAFETIADATENLVKRSSQGALRVRTYTTFAAKWLIPKLGLFRAQYPKIEVRISNGVPDVDFDRDPVDVAIQFGDGRWPRVQTDLLFRDEIEPVCAPAYLAQHAPNHKYPESLLRQRLLVSHYRRTDWEVWLQAMGYTEHAEEAEKMTLGSTILCWQAAVDNLGIAIGQHALLSNEFASGQLVRPFNKPLLRTQAYYLVRPEHQRETRKVQVFRDWLLSICEPIAQAQDSGAAESSSSLSWRATARPLFRHRLQGLDTLSPDTAPAQSRRRPCRDCQALNSVRPGQTGITMHGSRWQESGRPQVWPAGTRRATAAPPSPRRHKAPRACLRHTPARRSRTT